MEPSFPSPAAPAPTPTSRPKRKYVRKGPLSEAALEARRVNLVRARAADKDLIYRATEKREAASRTNLAKALAARKSPEGNAVARLNALKHGLYARLEEAAQARLGEDAQECAEHQQEFDRVFHPQDDVERELVRRLAHAIWRRRRVFAAMAWREEKRLRLLFDLDMFPEPGPLSVEETESRAYCLSWALCTYDDCQQALLKAHALVERALRALLRKRSGGKVKFKSSAHVLWKGMLRETTSPRTLGGD